MLWTIADDSGRLRAASRMLASLLYPYDDDAPALIEGWLEELEQEKCITRYVVDGTTYIQISKWLNHQKIDRPSKSNIPEFDEHSRAFASIREDPTTDLGPRTLDLGPKKEGADAQNDVVFEGAFLKRLLRRDLDRWRVAYPHVEDMLGEIQKADDFYASDPPKNGKPFFVVSAWLARVNKDEKANDPYRGVEI